MGGAPPLPADFAPQGAKNGHFSAIFLPEDLSWARRDPDPGRRAPPGPLPGPGMGRVESSLSTGAPHGGVSGTRSAAGAARPCESGSAVAQDLIAGGLAAGSLTIDSLG